MGVTTHPSGTAILPCLPYDYPRTTPITLALPPLSKKRKKNLNDDTEHGHLGVTTPCGGHDPIWGSRPHLKENGGLMESFFIVSADVDADVNECEPVNPCAHLCVDKPVGYECRCRAGFRPHAKDAHLCADVDECVEATPCSQLCRNTHGSYACSCADGYVATHDGHSCKTNSSQFLLLDFLYSFTPIFFLPWLCFLFLFSFGSLYSLLEFFF